MNNFTHYKKQKLGLCPRTDKPFFIIRGPKLHIIQSYTTWGYTEDSANLILRRLSQIKELNKKISNLHKALKIQDENIHSSAEILANQRLEEFSFWLKAHPPVDASQISELFKKFIEVTS